MSDVKVGIPNVQLAHANVYNSGDQDEMVYFIETGQIKLLMLSSEGKECLLAIYSDGDIFGELCLSGLGARLETATAMKTTVLKQIPWTPRKKNGWKESRSSSILAASRRVVSELWRKKPSPNE